LLASVRERICEQVTKLLIPARSTLKSPGRGFFVSENSKVDQTPLKRAIFFFDVQNLFHAVGEAFNISEPNFDPIKLSDHFCKERNWLRSGIFFYTGIPDSKKQPRWGDYWLRRLRVLRNQKNDIQVFTTQLKYRDKFFPLPESTVDRWVQLVDPDGKRYCRPNLYDEVGQQVPKDTELTAYTAEEKGIDVQIALDLIMKTLSQSYDVSVLFCQDQDQNGSVRLAKEIADSQGRQVEIFSSFPAGLRYDRGILGTSFLRISRETYDSCIDPRNYFASSR
jgi:uncharacterized LabA/DUF88 family protein